ncbi:YXWGXW repeat-containing protein [Desulforhopalus sp. IMCC35007]|uniref:YXWGXW repeat-containing protein n=1 Tax=Desulforhopalus sp. IMCC35007 TaxID=2569543 RepID=UPI00145CBC09|nr:YXWGXW repeat-containing protein [Desulforhopalus sp. IMCC35007]
MLQNYLLQKVFIVALSIGLSCFLQTAVASAASDIYQTDDGVEVLTRGPIHEAFADVSVDEKPAGIITTRPVPEPINEIPPEFRPEGEQVTWIPGYWSWDEDQDDFIWVSGVWRDVPPDRQWVSGYWLSIEGGSQYISGYWADTNQSRTEFLPPPPEPLEVGPSSPPTSPDFVWIEGSWIWTPNGYAWQTGYWHAKRPDMVWIPAHYVWTPHGFVFVMGYWDYQISRRGLMFAPLYYSRPIYRNHGYFYSPAIVLDFDAVFLSLFIRDSHHYYFGDYYDPRYEKRGFHPWYSNRATRFGHDPYYRNYRSHRLRNDKNWEKNYHQQFEYRRNHEDARPPRIYGQKDKHKDKQLHYPATQMIGRRLVDVVENKSQPLRFTHVKTDNRRDFQKQQQNQRLNNIQTEHRKFEAAPATPKKSEVQPHDQKHFKQEQKPKKQPQVQPQEQKQLRQEQKPKKQPQVQPQEQKQLRQEQKPKKQPQVQPQEQKQFRQEQKPKKQPQVQSQEQKQFRQKGKTEKQHQVVPDEDQQLTPQGQTEARGKSNKGRFD